MLRALKLRAQVARYRWNTLTTTSERAWLIVGALLLVVSILGLVKDSRESLVLFVLGLVSVGVPIVRWQIDNRGRRATLYQLSEGELSEFAQKLSLPAEMVKTGYEVDPQALMIVSREVNRALRNGADWAFKYADGARKRLAERLLSDNFRFDATNALRAFAAAAISGSKDLTNDPKVGLASELPIDGGVVQLKETDYFTTLITNDLAPKVMRDRKERKVFNGLSSLFPVVDELGGRRRFLDLSASTLSNHIGASILGITSDSKLILWSQGHRAQQASGRRVPTGSGSCDVADFNDRSFIEAIKRTMQRELSEESSRIKSAPRMPYTDTSRIWVVGHGRNLLRAGKPEFFGVARLGVQAHELEPDIAELVDDGGDRDSPQCSNLAELRATCVDLLGRSGLSLILRANLQALLDACDEEPAKAETMLFADSATS